MRFIVEPEARREIQEAMDYLAEVAPDAIAGFLDDLAAVRRLIVEHPHAHPKAGSGTRRVLLASHPYQLVYRVEGETIVVYAVAHLKRRPRYWRGRVK